MVVFRPTCRQCYHEKGITVLLEERQKGEWVCPKDPRHKTKDDVEVA